MWKLTINRLHRCTRSTLLDLAGCWMLTCLAHDVTVMHTPEICEWHLCQLGWGDESQNNQFVPKDWAGKKCTANSAITWSEIPPHHVHWSRIAVVLKTCWRSQGYSPMHPFLGGRPMESKWDFLLSRHAVPIVTFTCLCSQKRASMALQDWCKLEHKLK